MSKLYKLKFFCSLCQKQLKDDNGYKCHLRSDSHKKMMGTYMTNPEKLMNTFSQEFQDGFIDTLKRHHPHTAALANTVYQEFIKDQYHVHMNSTRWSSLTDFVKFLETKNICEVDWNEGRPIIKHIDANAKEVTKETEQEKRIRKRKREADREDRYFRQLGEMAEREKNKAEKEKKEEIKESVEVKEVPKKEDAQKITFNLNINLFKAQQAKPQPVKTDVSVFKKIKDEPPQEDLNKREAKSKTKTRNNIDMLLQMVGKNESDRHKAPIETHKRQRTEESESKSQETKDEPWLSKGIIVKVMEKALGGGKFYKQRAKVYKVATEFAFQGNIKILSGPSSGTKLSMDQANLAPITPVFTENDPAPEVKIIKGKYKGSIGILNKIDEQGQSGIIENSEGEILKLNFDSFAEFVKKK